MVQPGKEYFCIQTTMSEDFFSLRNFVLNKRHKDENTYNFKKINITEIHDFNFVKDSILGFYENLNTRNKKNTTIIHFEIILNTNNIYQKENQNQLKEKIHALFKKEIKQQSESLIKKNINYIHLELNSNKKNQILCENICSFIINFVKDNKNVIFHHTIVQKYAFFDYEKGSIDSTKRRKQSFSGQKKYDQYRFSLSQQLQLLSEVSKEFKIIEEKTANKKKD